MLPLGSQHIPAQLDLHSEMLGLQPAPLLAKKKNLSLAGQAKLMSFAKGFFFLD